MKNTALRRFLRFPDVGSLAMKLDSSAHRKPCASCVTMLCTCAIKCRFTFGRVCFIHVSNANKNNLDSDRCKKPTRGVGLGLGLAHPRPPLGPPDHGRDHVRDGGCLCSLCATTPFVRRSPGSRVEQAPARVTIHSHLSPRPRDHTTVDGAIYALKRREDRTRDGVTARLRVSCYVTCRCSGEVLLPPAQGVPIHRSHGHAAWAACAGRRLRTPRRTRARDTADTADSI